MSYRIVGDSCTDLTPEMKEKGNVQIVSLTLTVDGVDYRDDETFDQKAYEALMAKYDEMCIASLEPLEKAYELMPDGDFKKNIAATIKQVCFVLRNKDAKFMEKYEYYNELSK